MKVQVEECGDEKEGREKEGEGREVECEGERESLCCHRRVVSMIDENAREEKETSKCTTGEQAVLLHVKDPPMSTSHK